MSQEQENIPNVTIANLFKLEASQPVKLTSNFLEALKPEVGDFAIIILTPNTKIIRIIPTVTTKVYKISIDIGQLHKDFLKQIGNLFLDLGLKALYSTGLCFLDEKCVFDGYIDSNEFKKIDVEKVRKEILKIEGIAAVDISIIEVE